MRAIAPFPSKFKSRCPFCGRDIAIGTLIIKRDGKYGHTSCPDINAPVAIKALPDETFEPSKYQAAVYEEIQFGSGNIVVIATAGSGKTSTIRHSVPYLPSGAKVAAVAFNKRNATDLQNAMGSSVQASTFHSLGLRNVKKQYPDIDVQVDKTWRIIDGIAQDDMKLAEPIESDRGGIRKLVDLSRNTLSNDLESIAEHYGVTLEFPEASFTIARETLRRSNANTDMADFGDMLLWCVNGQVRCEQFDYFLQDEAQDAPQVQIEFAKLSLAPGGRLFALGDPRQALYAWSGSAVDSIDQITAYHNARNLPLSITYRMPLSHIEYVNGIFPGANIEPRPNAPDGEILNVKEHEMIRDVEGGDLVVCRVNAPLVAPAFELIRQGRKAVILGRDIGKGLETLLTKTEKRNRHISGLSQIILALRIYADKEVAKLLSAKKLNQASSLQDQVETIMALSDGCDTVGDIRKKIRAVFSDENEGVVFSSIHKAKGSESRNVYMLRPDLCPHPMAKEEWQQAGEQNCLFVALTRSKGGLYFVEPPQK